MASKKEETASFMLRFTQKIFENETGGQEVQWRGNIRHVQGGDEKRFSEFDEVVQFIQSKLTDLTIQAMEDKSPEEQKGILAKSFQIWKKMATDGENLIRQTIKDPKKGVAQIQGQIQGQLEQVKEDLGQKIDLDAWLSFNKKDSGQIMDKLEALTNQIADLNAKVDGLSKKKSK